MSEEKYGMFQENLNGAEAMATADPLFNGNG